MEDNTKFHTQLFFQEAIQYHEKGLINEAEIQYSKILTIDPYHKEALYNLSLIHFNRRDYEKALDLLNRCLKIDPKDAQTINLIGLTFEALGNKRSAEGCFKRAIQLRHYDYMIHYNFANLLSRQGRTEEAVSYTH
ncbi:MAG: tetratricopeptide repeat protein, partial [Thermodesulfovibrionales bacterium]|nr:tetratricopeptide repeat protein [Thermodesulfovibrionales bacterium]